MGWGTLGPIKPDLGKNSAQSPKPLPTASHMSVGFTGEFGEHGSPKTDLLVKAEEETLCPTAVHPSGGFRLSLAAL